MKAPSMSQEIIEVQDVLQQNNDIRNGKKAITKNRDKYINRLELQTDDQFKSMVDMAPIYVLYPKIVDGFVGTVFTKPPILDGTEAKLDNVDMLGNAFDKIAEKVVQQVLENGFCATINDYSADNRKSFIRFIAPEQFVSIRTNSDRGYPIISQFIYREDVEVDDEDDEFSFDIKTQYVVLDLDEQGLYRVRTYLQVSQEEQTVSKVIQDQEVELIATNYPRINGNNFDRIPMTIHGIEANNFSVSKSPLQDLSDMNISIIQRVIDQVYMLHWTALPTPYVIGADADDSDSPYTIGPTRIWYIGNEAGKVGMLEFTGQSARAHQDFIDNLKDIMAATGAQILKKEGVSRETATSVLVRTAAQTSLVGTIVKNVSQQLSNTLKIYLEWNNEAITDEFHYRLNDDFIKVDMEPNAQIALVKSWLDGAISHETVFKKMKAGEIIEPNRTFEDELAAIQKYPPPFFSKEKDAEISEEQAEMNNEFEMKTMERQERSDKQDMEPTGSNLETPTEVPNKLASEQV